MLTIFKDSLKPWYHAITKRNYREYYRLFSKYASSPRYQQKSIRFLNYRITVPDALSFVYQFKEIFLEESYKFYSSVPNPVIYDCGANIGLSCLYFKSQYPQSKLKAFEADPQIFRILKSNLDINLGSGSIEVHDKAIWINNNGVEFTQEGSDGGSIGKSSSPDKIRVESLRLRDLLQSERVDLLKIDIEGAEAEVLMDCDGYLGNVGNIFFEYHSIRDQPQKLNSLLDVMSRNGFRYFIQSPYQLNAPFINVVNDLPMDLQLNVYCYKSRVR